MSRPDVSGHGPEEATRPAGPYPASTARQASARRRVVGAEPVGPAVVATAADRPDLEALRHRVFVEEQAVPVELERDELDDVATHAVARDAAGRVVGTGRLVVRAGGVGRIGRMAVAAEARRAGVGAALLAVLEAAAVDAGCARAELHAQTHAVGFYRRAGYRSEGSPFDDAGIPHVAMWKVLSR